MVECILYQERLCWTSFGLYLPVLYSYNKPIPPIKSYEIPVLLAKSLKLFTSHFQSITVQEIPLSNILIPSNSRKQNPSQQTSKSNSHKRHFSYPSLTTQEATSNISIWDKIERSQTTLSWRFTYIQQALRLWWGFCIAYCASEKKPSTRRRRKIFSCGRKTTGYSNEQDQLQSRLKTDRVRKMSTFEKSARGWQL